MKSTSHRDREISLDCAGYQIVFHCSWWQRNRATAYDTWLEMIPTQELAAQAPIIQTTPQLLRSEDVERLLMKFDRYLRRLDEADEFFDVTIDWVCTVKVGYGWYDESADRGRFSLELFGPVGRPQNRGKTVEVGVRTKVELGDARRFVDELRALSFEPET